MTAPTVLPAGTFIKTPSGQAAVVIDDESQVCLTHPPTEFGKSVIPKPRRYEVISPKEAKPVLADAPVWYVNRSIYVGTDPEFWLLDAAGEMVPAFERLATKIAGVTGQTFYDGFQGEFTVPHNFCLELLRGSIRSRICNIPNLAQGCQPSVLDSIQKLKPAHLQCDRQFLKLGCSPSSNVYGLESSLGLDPAFIPYRFAGCHMHFSIGPQPATLTPEAINRCVKMMDKLGGVGMCALFGHYEQVERRHFYGLAGEYRQPAPNRLEWRVPGPQVLCHPAIYMLSFELARLGFKLGLNGLGQHFWQCTDEEAIEVINTSNQTLARQILQRKVNRHLLQNWTTHTFGQECVAPTHQILMKGMDSKIAEPAAMVKNWIYGANSWAYACGCLGKV